MKIDAVDFSKALQQELGDYSGLEDIKMSRLGRLVVVAGANGAGKSRLFKSIADPHIWISNQDCISRRKKEALTEEISKLMQSQVSNDLILNIEDLNKLIKSKKYILSCFDAVKTANDADYEAVKYVTEDSNERLRGANSFSTDQIITNSECFSLVGSSSFQHAPSYIHRVFSKANNASNPRTLSSSEDIEKAISNEKTLNFLLNKLLGNAVKPSFHLDNYVTLFGFKDYEKKLSQGQQIMLQLACAVHAQGALINNSIIFFDEPENHLHPAALIEVIDQLDKLTSDGQLWIATHSVPLIAHLAKKDPNCLWYMENGSVQHAGRKPELVLQGLMGGQAGIQALQDFTLLPSQLAINRFLSECLNPPTTASASVNDPQTSAITRKIQALRRNLEQDAKLRVLDYGAGKGRLLDALQAIDSGNDLKTWLDYRAYDPFEDDKTSCIETICRTYDTADGRYFNNLTGVNSLGTVTDDASYDLIVMCNVLHEINPDDWLNCFGNSSKSRLTKLLKAYGGLLVVEDYEIPTGELAHKHGFLLLDEPELKALFAWKEADLGNFIRDSAKDRYKDRLVMHWIAHPLLERVTNETRHKAISTLKDNANNAIDCLQNQSINAETFSRGHQIALASQTYTNAARWIEKNPS